MQTVTLSAKYQLSCLEHGVQRKKGAYCCEAMQYCENPKFDLSFSQEHRVVKKTGNCQAHRTG